MSPRSHVLKAKGYSKRRAAPVLKLPANKSIKCKMISAIGNAGDLFFMFHKETMNTDIFKDFILRLTTDREEWESAYSKALKLIRKAAPDSKLVLTLSTPLRPAEKNRHIACSQ